MRHTDGVGMVRALLTVVVALALVSGCGGDGGREIHSVRGQVVRLADGGRQLVVDHEAVPGRMDAMRMTLPLQDPQQARGLAAGDKIRFELSVSGGRASIGQIERLPATAPLALAGPGDAGSAGSATAPGDPETGF